MAEMKQCTYINSMSPGRMVVTFETANGKLPTDKDEVQDAIYVLELIIRQLRRVAGLNQPESPTDG